MPDQPELQIISGRLERGEIDSAQFLEQLMRYVAAQIGCTRAAFRVFVDIDAGRVLRCAALYDGRTDRMEPAVDVLHAENGAYLDRLQSDGCVCAPRVLDDRIAVGALRDYLETTGIVSLMDMSFSVNGVLFGTFSCEQVATPIDWTQRQLQTLRKIAARASLTLMHVVTATVDTAPGALWETSTPNRLATMPMPLHFLPE